MPSVDRRQAATRSGHVRTEPKTVAS